MVISLGDSETIAIMCRYQVPLEKTWLKTYVIIHLYSYGMPKLFFLTQAVIILATISICGVFLTIIIPVQDVDSQQEEQQLSADAIFKMVEKSVVGITTPETIEEEEGDDSDSDPIYDGSGFVYAKTET